MRSSNKPRSRNKNRNNNRSNLGNVVNRVFDSSGPEGKVRGTPQQIIEKYQMLARDAQVAGDRIAHENFLQHAEHYVRLLGEAQKEMDQRREQQEAQRQNQQQNNNNNSNNAQNHELRQQQPAPQAQPQPDVAPGMNEQPALPESADLFPADKMESNLVQTPESQPEVAEKKPAPRKRQPAKPRAPRKPKKNELMADLIPENGSDKPSEPAAETKAAE